MKFTIRQIGICSVVLIALLLSQVSTSQTDDQTKGSKPKPCSNISSEIAQDVEICSKPALDLIEGTLKNSPKNESGVHGYCLELLGSERCIKDQARRCGHGIQKTIISTIGSSVQKARKIECVKSQYKELLDSIKCIEDNRQKFRSMMANATNLFRVVETQMKDLSQRINAICCSAISLKTELLNLMDSTCPRHTELVTRLYNTLLDDVMNLVCRSSKCNDVFRGHVIPKFKLKADRFEQSGIIATILRIIFSIDNLE